MTIESGNVSLRRYMVEGKMKEAANEHWLEGLKKGAFESRKLLLDDENVGWSVFGNELEMDFNIENTVRGKFLIFSMRRERIKIPGALLKLHVKSRLQERLKEMETKSISKKQQTEIRVEIQEELAKSLPPDIQVFQAMVDTKRGEVYFSSFSDKVCEFFIRNFEQSFGLRLLESNFMALASHNLTDDVFERVLDDPGMKLGPGIEVHPEYEDTSEGKLGAGFLTWVLHTIQTGEGVWKSKHHGEFGIIVDDYLFLEGESVGSRQTLLKKGSIGRCAELATALGVGKLVSKVRLQLAREGKKDEVEEWNFYVDKLNFDLASIKVPKVNDPDPAMRMQMRLGVMVEAFELIDDLFEHYLELRYGNGWKRANANMVDWVQQLAG